MNILKRLWLDKYFWFALAAAILYWIGLFLMVQSGEIHFGWVFVQPFTFLLFIVLYPVLEELAFRGLIQGLFYRFDIGKRRFAFVSVANFMTSLLFSGFHFFSHSTLWALSVFIPSLLFGYFREKYNSTLPAVLLHIYFNLGYFLLFPPM